MGKKGARGGKGGNKFASDFVYTPPKLEDIGRSQDNAVVNLCISMLECPAIRTYADCVHVARFTVGDVKRLVLKRHGEAMSREDVELYLVKQDSKLVPREYLEDRVYEIPKHILQGSDLDNEWRVKLDVRHIGHGGPSLLDIGVKGVDAPVGGFLKPGEGYGLNHAQGKVPTVNILYSAIPVRLNPTCPLLESEPWQVDPLESAGHVYDPEDPEQRAVFLSSVFATSPAQVKTPARGSGARAMLDIGNTEV